MHKTVEMLLAFFMTRQKLTNLRLAIPEHFLLDDKSWQNQLGTLTVKHTYDVGSMWYLFDIELVPPPVEAEIVQPLIEVSE